MYAIVPNTKVEIPIMACDKDYNIHLINADEKQTALIEDSTVICFQESVTGAEDSIEGIFDIDLLEIVRDRLNTFQKGEYSCNEVGLALIHIEEALFFLGRSGIF